MKFTDAAVNEMTARLLQLGLSSCVVCGADADGFQVRHQPTFEQLGGLEWKKSDPRYDKKATVLYLLHIECNRCGHVLLFNSERLVSSSDIFEPFS